MRTMWESYKTSKHYKCKGGELRIGNYKQGMDRHRLRRGQILHVTPLGYAAGRSQVFVDVQKDQIRRRQILAYRGLQTRGKAPHIIHLRIDLPYL